jgi:putative ABC transport system permease protein
MNINNNPIDYDYLKTLGFELLQGRNFSPERISDSTAVIITETAANLMGFENPIGQRVDFGCCYGI